MLLTMTLLDIQLRPHSGHNPLQSSRHSALDRRGQQHLLAQNVFQQKTLALIIADFGLGFADRTSSARRSTPKGR